MPKHREPLTYKQKAFVKEYIKTKGNGTKAALRVYGTTSKDTAKSIASDNLEKPAIKAELAKLLRRDDRNLERITGNVAGIANEQPIKGYSGSEILEANKTLLKLHGVLTDRKMVTSYSINADLDALSEHELIQLRNKKRAETDTIIDGEEL